MPDADGPLIRNPQPIEPEPLMGPDIVEYGEEEETDDKSPVLIPMQFWNQFQFLRQYCKDWDTNYASVVRFCITRGKMSQFAEWLADRLSPADWNRGIDNGFAPMEPTNG